MPVQAGAGPMQPLPGHPPVRLVAVGRHVQEKGIDVLLDAVEQMEAVELDVVGDGPLLDAHRARVARMNRHTVVRFRAPMTKHALLALIDGAHAVVVPSRREGLGLVALEAMARGRPVIASRVGGLVKVVDDGPDGILVPPGDAPALTAAIGRLPLSPPVGRALERHRPDVVLAAHLSLYGAP